MSKDIQNKLISLIADHSLKAIVDRVKCAKYFSVIMDCTPDVSHMEQLSVVSRL
ncbi:UNVERIFIED_CONTAM: hypothetical protein FKN15_000960 [Acipenser sinensis]